MEVDYAGMTLPITNPETGEIWHAPVFVATLPASAYVYAEVQPSQELQYWLAGHVRAFAFFGGVATFPGAAFLFGSVPPTTLQSRGWLRLC